MRVFALCPGAVATEFFDVIQADVQTKADTPERVVEVGLKAFERGRHYVIPGAMNTLQSNLLPRLLPRGFLVRMVGTVSQRVMKPRAASSSSR